MGQSIMLAVILGVFLFVNVEGAFNASFSRNVAFSLSLAARSNQSAVCLANLLPTFKLFLLPLEVPCDENNTNNAITCQAITAVDRNAGIVAFAFRGTTSTQQLAEENTTDTVLFQGKYHVQKYFDAAFGNLYGKGLRSRMSLLTSAYPTFNYICTGHSLGAAISSLAAITLSTVYNITKLSVYGYGMPRVGLGDYASYVESLIPDNHRVTHMLDPVPHLPPAVSDYVHAKSEYWFQNNMSVDSFTVCSNDQISSFFNPNCSNSKEVYILNSLNTTNSTLGDHDLYYGVSITNYSLAGCPLNNSTASPSTTPNPSVCPNGWIHSEFGSKCYKFINNTASWVSSEVNCNDEGGHLVSIDTAFENLEIHNLGEDFPQCELYYIGLYWNVDHWEWINGDNSTYVSWASGYPTSTNMNNELCVAMDNRVGLWKNTDCAFEHCSICVLSLKK